MAEQTEQTLEAWAEQATNKYLADPHRVTLTAAVTEALRPHAKNITREHARRVCEKTYHKAYRALFQRGPAPRADRTVDFGQDGPPRADEVATALRLAAVEAAGDPRTPLAGGGAGQVKETRKEGGMGKQASESTIPKRTWHPAPPPEPVRPAYVEKVAEVVVSPEAMRNKVADDIWAAEQDLGKLRAALLVARHQLPAAAEKLASTCRGYAEQGVLGYELLRAADHGIELLDPAWHKTAHTEHALAELARALDGAGIDVRPPSGKTAAAPAIPRDNPVAQLFAKVAGLTNQVVLLEGSIAHAKATIHAMKVAGLADAAGAAILAGGRAAVAGGKAGLEATGNLALAGARRFGAAGSPYMNTAMAGVATGGLAHQAPEVAGGAYSTYQRLASPHNLRLGEPL